MVLRTELSLPGLDALGVNWVRWELFVLPAVRDVLPGAAADTVVVVHEGPARPDLWRAVLQEQGIGVHQGRAA